MLLVFAAIYGMIVDLRNRLYDKGIFRTHDLGARTISIGNITTGGTGKTPLVAYAASILAERGEKVCILTRGYGRVDQKNRVLVSDGNTIFADAAQAGDEPLELARKLMGKAIVIADADRAAAAEWAKGQFGVKAFVLDDGFQHRKAKRDVDIVCIDATNAAGDWSADGLRSGKLLPAGRLREDAKGLARADAVVITRSDLVDDISDLRSEISKLAPGVMIFELENKIRCLMPLDESCVGQSESEAADALWDMAGKGYAFCGIGNPKSFLSMLDASGVSISGSREFTDHHAYSNDDLRSVETAAKASGANFLLTTAKDAVKLSDMRFELPCYVVEIEVQIDHPQKFAAML